MSIRETYAAAPERTAVSAFDWACVVGGAAVAAALAFVFLTFGAAVGLTIVSPWQGSGAGATTVGVLAVAWYLFASLFSYLVGGYLAGRLRAHPGDANAEEATIRDGLHGLAVWGVGVLLTVAWLAFGATAIGAGAAKVGETAAKAAAPGGAAQDARASSPADYLTDMLFRREQQIRAEVPAGLRTEASRIIGRSLVNNGQLGNDDRGYLTRATAASMEIDPAQAEQRVNRVASEVQRLAAEAKAAADQARRATAIGGFVVATAFMIALAAAWGGALYGGAHRARGIVIRPLAWRTLRQT